jgi:hypothetical protein
MIKDIADNLRRVQCQDCPPYTLTSELFERMPEAADWPALRAGLLTFLTWRHKQKMVVAPFADTEAVRLAIMCHDEFFENPEKLDAWAAETLEAAGPVEDKFGTPVTAVERRLGISNDVALGRTKDLEARHIVRFIELHVKTPRDEQPFSQIAGEWVRAAGLR